MSVAAPQFPQPSWLARATMWAGDALDRVALAWNPEVGARRIQFRRNFARLSAARGEPVYLSTFEGAQKTETRDAAWIGSQLSTDSALEEDRDSLVSRSREMYRNDSFGGTVDCNVNQVVGTGFTPQSKIGEAFAGTEASRFFNEEMTALYKRWSARVDTSRRISLWQQTRLLQRHIKMDGEGLAVMSAVDDDPDDRVLPLAIEIIDPMRLETPPQLAGNKLIRMGVEKDESGRIIYYWIRKAHPGDTVDIDQNYDRVPADRVLHVFERWFAAQTRGLPWLCRAVARLKDAKDLDEANLARAQVQACFSIFITPSGGQYGQQAANAAASSSNGSVRYEDIRPGAIRYGTPGEKIDFPTPPAGNGSEALQDHNMRRIAAALNIPYEVFAKNWNGMSFAGGRIVLTDLRLDVESQQQLIIEQFLTPIWDRMVFWGVLVGAVSIEPRVFFTKRWRYTEHQWTPQAWPYALNPGEEFDAQMAMVDAGAKTLEDVIGEMGDNFYRVQKQRGIERKTQAAEGSVAPPVEAGGGRVAA